MNQNTGDEAVRMCAEMLIKILPRERAAVVMDVSQIIHGIMGVAEFNQKEMQALIDCLQLSLDHFKSEYKKGQ
jgi:hypothetical protein